MSQDLNAQLNELLEKAFAAGTEQYHELGFKRRVGYGNRPAVIHIDMANAWTREGHPFSCENMDTIIPACQALNEAAREKGIPVIYTTTAYDITDRSKPSDMGLWSSKIPVELLDRRLRRRQDRRPHRPGTRRTGHHQKARQRLPRHQPPAVPYRQPHRHRDHHRRHRGRLRPPHRRRRHRRRLPPHRVREAVGDRVARHRRLEPLRHRLQIRRRRTPRQRHLLPQQPPRIQRNHHPVTHLRHAPNFDPTASERHDMKRIGVDVGGTFTDLYSRMTKPARWSSKRSLHPGRPVAGGAAAAWAADRQGRHRIGRGGRTGPRHHRGHQHRADPHRCEVGMITTEGFRDILHIARTRSPTTSRSSRNFRGRATRWSSGATG